MAYHEAVVLLKLEREGEALQALERAYAHNPNRLPIINDLGSYYAKAGRHEEAIALFTTTAQRYAQQIGVIENLALAYIYADDYSTALEVLEGIPEDQRTDSIREKIADCLEQLNRPAEAAGPEIGGQTTETR